MAKPLDHHITTPDCLHDSASPKGSYTACYAESRHEQSANNKRHTKNRYKKWQLNC